MAKRFILLSIVGAMVATQIGCVPLAAGVAGAAVGHKVTEDRDKHDHDRD
jgi:hypothetical protein